MEKQIRTDLAIEAKELWSESAGKTDRLPGVEADEKEIDGFRITEVKILDKQGEKALGKPKGTYFALEADPYLKKMENSFETGCDILSGLLKRLLDINPQDCVMAAGLGNADITPDVIGPAAVKYIMVTRHLVSQLPEHFGSIRPVSAFVPGVLAETGIESGELIRAAAEKAGAKAVMVIDALASRKLSRVCRTIQISDAGIVPGSGVGNSRTGINREFLGIPVIAIGIPTVVDAGTLAYDLVSQAGISSLSPKDFTSYGGDMIVTPRDIDKTAADMAKLLGYGINLALHDNLDIDDITMFLS